MIPCLYDSEETAYDSNGLGKLADAISCTVEEKRNSSYELKMTYRSDGIHADELTEGNIIMAKPSDSAQNQPFRIYKVTSNLSGELEICARHISYQLNFTTVSPFTATGPEAAMEGFLENVSTDCPFTFETDIESSAVFTLSVPASLRNCLGGMDGSMIDTFGGELEWDRYNVILHEARGTDNGVRIVYGKNLVSFKMEKSIENVITGLHPYWTDSETGAVLELPEKIITSSSADRSVPYEKISPYDFTGDYEEQPSYDDLRTSAKAYLSSTDLTEADLDIEINFIQLWNTPEYKDVAEAEQVSLCDTVTVYVSVLDVEVSMEVTETVFDVLLERYESITLSNSGSSSRNSSLSAAINDMVNE